MPAIDDLRPLKPGTRLLHVGPPKTGTTALQRTLHRSRSELEAHNVWLPSPTFDSKLAVWGGIDFQSTDECVAEWRRLVSATAITGDRIAVISSEFFADADDEHAVSVVDQLGGGDVHVVISLRPLVKILPSWWQEFVPIGLSVPYGDWLDQTLNRDGGNPMSWRWDRQQRHAALLDRWIAAVGRERVTVVIVGDDDRRRILGDFEGLLGIPEGTLALAPEQNRSLTAAEVEFIRLCFEEFRLKRLPRSIYRKYLFHGGLRRMKEQHRPSAEEGRMATPIWAQERAVAIGETLIDHVRASGVEVIGDLDRLRGTVEEQPEPDMRMDPAAAAQAMLGVLEILIEEQEDPEP